MQYFEIATDETDQFKHLKPSNVFYQTTIPLTVFAVAVLSELSIDSARAVLTPWLKQLGPDYVIQSFLTGGSFHNVGLYVDVYSKKHQFITFRIARTSHQISCMLWGTKFIVANTQQGLRLIELYRKIQEVDLDELKYTSKYRNYIRRYMIAKDTNKAWDRMVLAIPKGVHA